jgi:Acyl-CoA thioesterase N-terminal domain
LYRSVHALATPPRFEHRRHGDFLVRPARRGRTWERVPTLVPMRIARITVDLHRRVPLGRLEVRSEIAREGKRLQVVTATAHDPDGTEVARASALRYRVGVGPDAPTDPRLAPITTPVWGPIRDRRRRSQDLNGFMDAMESREGGSSDPAISWYRATSPVIAGEEPSPTVRLREWRRVPGTRRTGSVTPAPTSSTATASSAPAPRACSSTRSPRPTDRPTRRAGRPS